MEETHRAYGVPAKREQLVKRWLPFIADTTDRLYDDFSKIWHRELVQGAGLKLNPFMHPGRQRAFFAEIPKIPLDGSWLIWHRVQPELAEEHAKKQKQRQIAKEARLEFARWRKENPQEWKVHGSPSFWKYAAGELDAAGRTVLLANVDCIHPHAVADRWAKNKWNYPYFSTFILNMLYMCFHAAIEFNEPIDENAQGDTDVMTHLLRADAVVSNDTRYFKAAFDEMWRPKGKLLFTAEEFCDFLK